MMTHTQTLTTIVIIRITLPPMQHLAELAQLLDSRGKPCLKCSGKLTQVAQLSPRDRSSGWVTYGQKWKCNWETICMDIIGLSSTTVT